MNTYFHPRLRLAPQTNRWGLMPMFFPVNVATHSWFVAVYSMQIAMRIEYTGPMEQVLAHAILHDVPELWTGDICGPVKRQIVDREKMNRFTAHMISMRMGSLAALSEWFGGNVFNPDNDSAVYRIVKAADVLDDTFVCAQESAFGNDAMRARYHGCIKRLEEQWSRLPAETDLIKAAWADAIQSINMHMEGHRYDHGYEL